MQGSDGSKEENLCEQEQRQTKHDWEDTGGGGDKNRKPMTNDERDDAKESQTLTGCDITKYKALLARISYIVKRPTRSQVCGNARTRCGGKPVSI